MDLQMKPLALHLNKLDGLSQKLVAAAHVEAFMKNIRWDAVHRRAGAPVAGDAS